MYTTQYHILQQRIIREQLGRKSESDTTDEEKSAWCIRVDRSLPITFAIKESILQEHPAKGAGDHLCNGSRLHACLVGHKQNILAFKNVLGCLFLTFKRGEEKSLGTTACVWAKITRKGGNLDTIVTVITIRLWASFASSTVEPVLQPMSSPALCRAALC